MKKKEAPHPRRQAKKERVVPVEVDPQERFAAELRQAVAAYDGSDGVKCEPNCICSLSQALAAARWYVSEWDRYERGEFVQFGIPGRMMDAEEATDP